MEYLPAVLMALVPLVSAYLDSRRLKSDLTAQVIENVESAMKAQERVIQLKDTEIQQKDRLIEHLQDYISYLWEKIDLLIPKRKQPKRLENFKVRKEKDDSKITE